MLGGGPGEFLLNFRATGTEGFARSVKETTSALDKSEASAKRISRWRNELAQMTRRERDAAQTMEGLLRRRAQLEERIARAAGNQTRLAALRLRQAQNEQRIRAMGARDAGGGGGGDGAGLRDLISEVPGGARAVRLFEVLKGIGSRFLPVALIAGASAALGKLAFNGIRAAQAITDLSETTRISRRDLQALTFAASATKTEFGVVQHAFETMAKMQGEITSGLTESKEYMKAFQVLGQTMEDLRSKAPLELFTEITGKFQEGAMSNEEYAAALKVFGEQFKALIPAVRDGLGTLTQDFSQGNLAIRDGTLAMLDQVGDKWDQFWAKTKAGVKKGLVETAGGFVSLWKLAHGAERIVLGKLTGDEKMVADGEKMLEDRAKALVDHDGGAMEAALTAKLKDAKSARTNQDRRASLRSELQSVLGKDAADVIEDLEARNARPEEWERAIRVARRQKQKEKASSGDGGGGVVPSADALTRIGLFPGDNQALVTMQRQLNRLEAMHRELQAVNRNLTAE